MIKSKICGITNESDAKFAASMGYDYIGMVFYENSPRKISISNAAKISKIISGVVEPVGVFVNEEPETIVKTVKKVGLKLIQLHGAETPEYCSTIRNLIPPETKIIKAIGIPQNESPEKIIGIINSYETCGAIDYFLLDNSSNTTENETPTDEKTDITTTADGGSGIPINWELASQIVKAKNNLKFFLAGGLSPENVTEAIEKVAPWGVDASSRLERLPRRKDYDKMLAFIKAVKKL